MVEKMMPAARYVSGKMTSHLSMAGKMNADMTPNMNSLTGKGDLLMLSGLLSGFPITDQLGAKLNMPQLKSMPVKDMKLFFTFANGRVVIDPYKFKMDQIDAEVAGSHGFDQTIQYGVNMAVPTGQGYPSTCHESASMIQTSFCSLTMRFFGFMSPRRMLRECKYSTFSRNEMQTSTRSAFVQFG